MKKKIDVSWQVLEFLGSFGRVTNETPALIAFKATAEGIKQFMKDCLCMVTNIT